MNKTKGDMYSWVSHTWNPLNGQCPHRCRYCMAKRTTAGRMGFYDGPLRLNKNAMAEKHGNSRDLFAKPRTIFVCALSDLFADYVPASMIGEILDRVDGFPNNRYVFQTRNPERMATCIEDTRALCGTTVETDDDELCSAWSPGAPGPQERVDGILSVAEKGCRIFVTVEPIMRFTPGLAEWLISLRPDFVNIGADSGRNGLPEPSAADILRLRDMLTMAGVKVNLKSNLGRLLNAP